MNTPREDPGGGGSGADLELLRPLSLDLFYKEYVLETALAVSSWEEEFTTDDAFDEVKRRALAGNTSRPSRSSIHESLKRLHRLLALNCEPPAAKRGQSYIWGVRAESPFWSLLSELIGTDPGRDRSPGGQSTQ